MFSKQFEIRVDALECTSLTEGCALLEGKDIFDAWRYENVKLESGKIYGLVGEYQHGPRYLSYLLGGRVAFGDLKVFCNDVELSQSMLEQVSWNLEPSNEKYGKAGMD